MANTRRQKVLLGAHVAALGSCLLFLCSALMLPLSAGNSSLPFVSSLLQLKERFNRSSPPAKGTTSINSTSQDSTPLPSTTSTNRGPSDPREGTTPSVPTRRRKSFQRTLLCRFCAVPSVISNSTSLSGLSDICLDPLPRNTGGRHGEMLVRGTGVPVIQGKTALATGILRSATCGVPREVRERLEGLDSDMDPKARSESRPPSTAEAFASDPLDGAIRGPQSVPSAETQGEPRIPPPLNDESVSGSEHEAVVQDQVEGGCPGKSQETSSTVDIDDQAMVARSSRGSELVTQEGEEARGGESATGGSDSTEAIGELAQQPVVTESPVATSQQVGPGGGNPESLQDSHSRPPRVVPLGLEEFRRSMAKQQEEAAAAAAAVGAGGEAVGSASLPGEGVATGSGTRQGGKLAEALLKSQVSRLYADGSRYNYASAVHGAKVAASNKEAKKPNAVLDEDKDKYLRVPCSTKDKFIVIELSEFLTRVDTVVVSNYEYYSSSVKDFELWGSPVYPTDQWMLLGSFTAEDVRKPQSFELPPNGGNVRFVMLRWLSHHGSEYYCTLSLVRVYGLDELESLREEMLAMSGGGYGRASVPPVYQASPSSSEHLQMASPGQSGSAAHGFDDDDDFLGRSVASLDADSISPGKVEINGAGRPPLGNAAAAVEKESALEQDAFDAAVLGEPAPVAGGGLPAGNAPITEEPQRDIENVTSPVAKGGPPGSHQEASAVEQDNAAAEGATSTSFVVGTTDQQGGHVIGQPGVPVAPKVGNLAKELQEKQEWTDRDTPGSRPKDEVPDDADEAAKQGSKASVEPSAPQSQSHGGADAVAAATVAQAGSSQNRGSPEAGESGVPEVVALDASSQGSGSLIAATHVQSPPRADLSPPAAAAQTAAGAASGQSESSKGLAGMPGDAPRRASADAAGHEGPGPDMQGGRDTAASNSGTDPALVGLGSVLPGQPGSGAVMGTAGSGGGPPAEPEPQQGSGPGGAGTTPSAAGSAKGDQASVANADTNAGPNEQIVRPEGSASGGTVVAPPSPPPPSFGHPPGNGEHADPRGAGGSSRSSAPSGGVATPPLPPSLGHPPGSGGSLGSNGGSGNSVGGGTAVSGLKALMLKLRSLEANQTVLEQYVENMGRAYAQGLTDLDLEIAGLHRTVGRLSMTVDGLSTRLQQSEENQQQQLKLLREHMDSRAIASDHQYHLFRRHMADMEARMMLLLQFSLVLSLLSFCLVFTVTLCCRRRTWEYVP